MQFGQRTKPTRKSEDIKITSLSVVNVPGPPIAERPGQPNFITIIFGLGDDSHPYMWASDLKDWIET